MEEERKCAFCKTPVSEEPVMVQSDRGDKPCICKKCILKFKEQLKNEQ